MTIPSSPGGATRLAIALWGLAILAGFALALDYSASPSPRAAVGAAWPAHSPFARDAQRPTLLVFAHPHCPCTSATLSELEQLLALEGSRLAAHVLFFSDPDLGPGWEHSALWRRAAELATVSLHRDERGALARSFGASSSGETLLFAPDGTLLFQGGLTLARGHLGSNPGVDAVAALVAGREARAETPVFGCPLSAGPTP